MSQRKTKPGGKLTRVSEFATCIENGYWVYHRHKPYHPSFIAGWPFRTVLRSIRGGHLRYAMRADNGMVYKSEP